MSNLHVKYLIVGGGLAGSEAARAIREIDQNGDLLLVGQEINRPYYRPPLSGEFLRGEKRRADLFTLPPEWFVEHRVQLRTGRRASHLDAMRNCVMLDSGEELSFDRLLIATGAHASALRLPGAELPNLFYLRTLEDAERLQHAVEKARRDGQMDIVEGGKRRGRAVVIGGGVLGVELAASFSRMGLRVDLAMSGQRPWNRLAGETAGKAIGRILENRGGVNVHANGRVMRLDGDGRVQRVMMASGESVDCDFAVAATGVQINKEILSGTPITAEKAILVDESCRTNDENVWAAGDCAAMLDPLFGKHRLLDRWDSAAETGRIAGVNMAGGDMRFNSVSFFQSDILGMPVMVWGDARFVDRRIVRGTANAEGPEFLEVGVAQDGRVVQIVAVGMAKDREVAEELIRQRVMTGGKEELLKDPGTPLGRFLS
jgi:3-phenylpropionate/trans-cinnamate dioxygenase ferredoxin reductase subunit